MTCPAHTQSCESLADGHGLCKANCPFHRFAMHVCYYTYTHMGCAHRQQRSNLSLFYDVLQVNCCAYAVLIENMSKTFISNQWETAMTSQCHVTSASPKQANKEYTEGQFLSACISKTSAHPFLKLHTGNKRTLHIMMYKSLIVIRQLATEL